jgi:type III pantothenate kinase
MNKDTPSSGNKLLAVDVGNSHMVIGLYDGMEILCHWRIKTDSSITVDELAAKFHGLFSMEAIPFGEISGVIIASVVPPMQAAWAAFTQKYLQIEPLVVGANVNPGIEILLDSPREVGADRIVNAIAGFDRYHCPLIIVDFGTAITLDCVSGNGAYIGGVIAPGMAISMEALGSRTAKLPRVDISTAPRAAIGKNTEEAIKSGIIYGYAGLIDGLVRRIKN